MSIEVEATFLDVDHEALRRKLTNVGAELIFGERLMRRTVFDYEDLRLNAQKAWIRVRDEGDGVVVTYKQRQAETVDGMRELELQAKSYPEACDFFLAIGLSVKATQETKRENWHYKGCEISLDTWPHIPSFVEIEGPDRQVVQSVAEELSFDWSKAMFDSADAVYQNYFEVSRTEISTIPLLFGDLPEVLKAKKRS